MIQKFSPQVNLIDTITGMTPLELAIHEKNTIVAEVNDVAKLKIGLFLLLTLL